MVRFCILLYVEPTFLDGLNVGGKDHSIAVVLKAWPPNQQHQYHRGTRYKCKFLDLTLDLLNQK